MATDKQRQCGLVALFAPPVRLLALLVGGQKRELPCLIHEARQMAVMCIGNLFHRFPFCLFLLLAGTDLPEFGRPRYGACQTAQGLFSIYGFISGPRRRTITEYYLLK